MTGSVLVVEDDPMVRRGMTVLLTHMGHHVSSAASLAEAGAKLDAAMPTHLLLDLNLPDGPGTDILQRIRDAALPVRVAVVTGAADTALMDLARTLGADAIFVKPANWDQVFEWVAQP